MPPEDVDYTDSKWKRRAAKTRGVRGYWPGGKLC